MTHSSPEAPPEGGRAEARERWKACIPRGAGEWAALAFYVAGVIVFLGGFRAWRGYLADDAFITFRYAENIAAGHGIVFNIGGERVEGYTTPLLVLLLVPFAALRADLLMVTKFLGFAVNLAAIPALVLLLSSRLAWPRGHPLRSVLLFLPGLWLMFHPTLIHAISGMETSLTLLMYAAWVLAVDEAVRLTRQGWRPRARALWGLACLAMLVTLVRSESGAVVALGYGVLFLWRDSRRLALASGGIWAGLLLLYLLWKQSYFGYILPNPYYHKVATPEAGSLPGFADVRAFVLEYWTLLIVWPLSVAVSPPRAGRPLSPLELFALLAVSFHLVFFARVVPLMNFEFRFAWPAMVFVLVLVGCGLHRLASGERGVDAASHRGWTQACALAATVVVAGAVALRYVPGPTRRAIRHPLNPPPAIDPHTQPYAKNKRIGKVIGSLGLPYGTVIYGSEAGLIPYFGRTSAFDCGGLNDNLMARGSAEEKARRVATQRVDIDVWVTSSEALDAMALNPETLRSLGEGAERHLAASFRRLAADYFYCGTYFWPVDHRQYLHVWVRRDYPGAARVIEAFAAEADSFQPGLMAHLSPGSPIDWSHARFPAGAPDSRGQGRSLPMGGWSTSGLVPRGVADGATCFVAEGADPMIIVPGAVARGTALVEVDIRLSAALASAPAITSELYWRQGDSPHSERACLRFLLRPTTEWQTVAFPVGAHPLWYGGGEPNTLRFDPVTAPGEFWIRNLRLVPPAGAR